MYSVAFGWMSGGKTLSFAMSLLYISVYFSVIDDIATFCSLAASIILSSISVMLDT